MIRPAQGMATAMVIKLVRARHHTQDTAVGRTVAMVKDMHPEVAEAHGLTPKRLTTKKNFPLSKTEIDTALVIGTALATTAIMALSGMQVQALSIIERIGRSDIAE